MRAWKITGSICVVVMMLVASGCSGDDAGTQPSGVSTDGFGGDGPQFGGDGSLWGSGDGGGNKPGPCDFSQEPVEGQPGAPCAKNSDCDTNYCVEGPEGKICTRTCVDCCPQGFACEESTQGDAQFICVPKLAALCRPCMADAECAAVNPGALCIHYGAQGAYCGGSCDEAADCPVGYACEETIGTQGAGKQCVRKSGECTCSPKATQEGAKTYCAKPSGSGGLCKGERKCGLDGLSPCSAAEAQAELCNSLDDDCDGETDEDVKGETCSFSNQFGTCPGVETCKDGAMTCSGLEPKEEICNGQDDDCDGLTDEDFPDSDKDGKADCMDTDQDGDGTPDPLDCDPKDPDAYPGAQEVCNGKDDDCDKEVDEADSKGCLVFYADADGDEAGNKDKYACLCIATPTYPIAKGGDCDDLDKTVKPGATEVCNGKDDDCDGKTDEDFKVGEACEVGQGACKGIGTTVCGLDGNSTVCGAQTGSPGSETCDGVDNDCDGQTDEDYKVGQPCQAGVGGCVSAGVFKCDAGGASVVCDASPKTGSTEICDGVDNDCDGKTDETCDDDKDGYCQKGKTVKPGALCSKGEGDCNDSNAAIYPGAPELCDNKDNNCDGVVDTFDQDCSNTCGKGKKTCSKGQWSSCSAPTPKCTSGACCDGCNFYPSTTKCGAAPYKSEQICSGACGGQVRKQETWRYCTGSSASCGTSNLKTVDKGLVKACSGSQLCQASGGVGGCKACSGGCTGSTCSSQPKQVICIDAQFGGSNSGACYGGVCTKTLNLDIAKRLEAMLNKDTANAEGGGTWQVVLTRNDDTYPSLTQRVATCDNANAARVISIAVNAFTSTGVNGASSFYTKSSSKTFCTQLQEAVVGATGLANKTVAYTTGFTILSKPKASLVCMSAPGFLSNPSDQAKLKTTSFRDQIAEGLLYGIQKSFGYAPFKP